MSKGFQLATLAGALSLAMSGSVLAIDFDYGGWTATNGDIDETTGGMCQSGLANPLYTCSVVASGKGFKQINVTEVGDASSGVSYIMTIVTDQNAGGATGASADALGFADVSFVKMKLTLGGTPDATLSGITAKQVIRDGTGTGKPFESTTNINTGWANTAGSNIVVSQNLSDDGGTPGFAGDNFISNFTYSGDNDVDTGVSTGFEMSIDQSAGLASGQTITDGNGNTVTDPSINDIQVFALREKKGSKLTAAKVGSPIDLDGTGPQPGVTWAANEDIKAIWIGQEINLGTSADVNQGSLGSSFGYVSFQNVDAETTTSAFGFSETNSSSAWVWDDAFYVGTETTPPGIAP